jgi:hypothetical protein
MNYRNLLGIPFKEDGDDVYGINCYNLLRHVFKLHGYNVPKTNIAVCACKNISNKEIMTHAELYWEKIAEPIVPCGVLIKSINTDFASHIAAYIAKGKILHVTFTTRSVIEPIENYKERILGFYKFKGIQNVS